MERSRLITTLSDPASYPGAADAVEVRQTHISGVFLAGPFAYRKLAEGPRPSETAEKGVGSTEK